jgi:hypothetical protein
MQRNEIENLHELIGSLEIPGDQPKPAPYP